MADGFLPFINLLAGFDEWTAWSNNFQFIVSSIVLPVWTDRCELVWFLQQLSIYNGAGLPEWTIMVETAVMEKLSAALYEWNTNFEFRVEEHRMKERARVLSMQGRCFQEMQVWVECCLLGMLSVKMIIWYFEQGISIN